MAIIKNIHDSFIITAEKSGSLDLMYKYIEENSRKLKLSSDKSKTYINFLLNVFGEDWFVDEIEKYKKQTTSIFHVHPLIVAACNSTPNGLFEICTIAKYLKHFRKDKSYSHIIQMLKAPNSYKDTKYQLAIAFNVMNNSGRNLILEEPSSLRHVGDFKCNILKNEYIFEVSCIKASRVNDSFDNAMAMVVNNLSNARKSIPTDKRYISIIFNTNTVQEIKNSDVFKNLLDNVRNCFKSTTDIHVNNNIYSINSKVLSKDTEYPDFDINSFDKQATLLSYELKSGINTLDRYKEQDIYKTHSAGRFMIKYPEISENVRLKQLKQKLSDEYEQLKDFSNCGKIITLSTDQWYLINKEKTHNILDEYIQHHKDITCIVVTCEIPLVFREHRYEYLFVLGKKNKYSLSQEYFEKLLK